MKAKENREAAPKDEPDERESAGRDLASDLIDAIKSGDAAGVVDSLRALMATMAPMPDSEPSDGGEPDGDEGP
ncbi:hypothetical protein [Anaeromyxobacter diazotrophicus]|nr:hypothetical protein [Anaeromyxobacter diazotrophicus]